MIQLWSDEQQLYEIPDDKDDYQTLFDHASAEELLSSFKRLTENDKQLIRMRYVDQCSIEEIAAHFKMTNAAVYTALHRTKKRMEAGAAERRRTSL